MAFTKDYIELLYNYRAVYRDKRRIIGDWYGNITSGQLKVYSDESVTDFSRPEWFYIPDLDDLFEFLTNQIRAVQEKDEPAKLIELRFTPEKNWTLEVRTEDGLIHRSAHAKSPHEVLWNAINGLSVFAVLEARPEERAKIFAFKKKYGELAWRDIVADSGGAINATPVAQTPGKRASAEEKKVGFLTDFCVAWREVWRMWAGRL